MSQPKLFARRDIAPACVAFVLGALVATALWVPWLMREPTDHAVREVHHFPEVTPRGEVMEALPAPPPSASRDTQGPTLASIRWQTPQGWTQLPPVEEAPHRREFILDIDGVEGACVMAVWSPTPQMSNRLANLNRWRLSLGMSTVTTDELPGEMTIGQSPLGEFAWFDLRPEGDRPHMLVALLATPELVLSVRLMIPPGSGNVMRRGFLELCTSLEPMP
jgi:hypothetical protein